MKSRLANFTPLMDSLVERYDLITAAVYGRIWRYSESRGYCYATHATIAKEIGLSRSTVLRKINILVEDGYLKDRTPGLKNKPHEYEATYQAGITLEASAYDLGPEESQNGVSERNSAVPERNTTVSERNSQSVTVEHEETIKRQPKKHILKDSVDNQSSILGMWATLFPNKRQPKPTTLKSKIIVRFRSPLFRENWQRAMTKASESSHLQSEGWFQFEYFIRNDDNYQKILDGAFDSFDKQINQNGTLPDSSNYTADLEARREKARAKLRKVQA